MTDPRRNLPSVERLLGEPAVAALLEEAPRALVVAAVRAAVAEARSAGATPPEGGWPAEVAVRVRAALATSLRPVINATGVVLHTNLGRAPLAAAALEAMAAVASGYSTLEYDLETGARGSRHAHCRGLLVELTGAEDAVVVNNAAAALLLALAALAERGGAVVSRGELIEIGGSFRLPDIISRSGARLIEVGTTNRTHARDYEAAIEAETRLLLKVHRSNFRVLGFTRDVPAEELARLASARGLWSVFDLGSGLLVDLRAWGLAGEPTVGEAVESGMDLVLVSGDKLLGGPQAGIAVGRREAVARLKAHPIARAVRADRLTLAALEATLALYRDPARARREIPVLSMLTRSPEELRAEAAALCAALPVEAHAGLRHGAGEVGGGAYPEVVLPGTLVALEPAEITAEVLVRRLRDRPPHVVARIESDRVVLDSRTLLPGQAPLVASAVAGALRA